MDSGTVLRRRGYEYFEGWRFRASLFASVFGPIVGVILPLLSEPETSRAVVESSGWISRLALHLLILVACGLVVLWLVRASMQSTLTVDETGLRHRSGLPEQFRFGSQRNWNIAWRDLRDVSLRHPPLTLGKPPLGNHFQTVAHVTHVSGVLRIMPWDWVDPGRKEDKKAWWKAMLGGAKGRRALFWETPLMRAFAARGLLLDGAAPAPRSRLDRHPAGIAIAAAFVAAVAYFIVDGHFLLEETYASTPPYAWFAVAGIAAGALASIALRDIPGVPAWEPRAMAALFALGIALAAHPFTVRVNAWTDPGEFRSVEYSRAAGGSWEPREGNWPVLDFTAQTAYWDQYRTGDTRTFSLRRGGLGIVTVHMAPIYAEQRAFYRNR